MNSEIDKLLRDYNIPEGVLTNQELRLLKDGGIRDSDSDNEDQYIRTRTHGAGANAVEIETLKSIHRNQISAKEKQIQFLQADITRRDQLIELERRKLRGEFEAEMERVMLELRNTKARVIQSESQIPLIQEALVQVRDMLSGRIPESVYLRLRDIPDRDLPPSEWLLCNVWQMCHPYKKQVDFLTKQASKLREELTIANDKQHSMMSEIEHLSQLLNSKSDDEKRHVLDYNNNRKSMELELEKCREEVEILREKGARYDELLRDYNFTKQEKELVEEKLGYYNREPADVASKMVGTRIAEDNQTRKLQLLTQDKEYLTKQNISLLQKNKRLQDRLDRLQSQLLNQKNRSQQFLHQLLNLKTDSQSSYQQRIYKEISELKEKHHLDLQTSKNNLVDIYQKQIRFLKEANDEKEIKLKEVDTNYREKEREGNQLLLDNRTFQMTMNTNLAEVRVSLKIKTEELDRMNNIYEETLSNLKAHKIENEMLREKVNLLKGEYYKSEANSKDQLSNLRAQIAVLKEQLSGYELIEKEIDEAVMSLSNLKPNDNNIFLNTINSVPSLNKRRVQQALGLAQRLQAKQREVDQIGENIRTLQQENERLKNQLRVSKQLLANSNQPYSYLVTTIQQKQKQMLSLRNSNKKKEQDYQNIKAQYTQLTHQFQQAQNDIKRLLIKRENIQNIQNLLINLVSGTTSKNQINNVIEEIQYILGNETGVNTTGKSLNNQSDTRAKSREEQLPAWYQKLNEKRKK